MGRKQIKRHTRQYQLRDEHPIDQHVDSILDFWKGDRQELSNFRKAITIFYALQQGDMQPLLNEFPQYKQTLSNDIEELKKMVELVIARQKAAPTSMLQPPPATGKLIGGFKPLAAPVDDDDDMLPALTVKKNVGDSSANFLVSLQSQI